MKKMLPYIILHLIILLYSVGNIFSKIAATKPFLSTEWIALYLAVIIVLGVYAILWSQILKKVTLNIAFANKAMVVVWGILWGALIFKERVNWIQIIGAMVIIIGVIISNRGIKEHE